jgi:hypothetical protein
MMKSTRTRLAMGAAFAVLASISAAIGLSQRAHAITANSSAYTIMYINEDRFRNWDFHCNSSLSCVSRTNVDWPMLALFYNNAEINKVKDNILEPRYDWGGTCASSQHARLDDGNGMNWDSDSGKKTTCCPGSGWPNPSTADHIRFYAAGTGVHDRMYNTAWGYWLIGSAHQDHNEPQCTTASSWFGYNETAEHNLFTYWTNNLGRPGWEDQQSWSNYQYNDQGNHYVRSDGRASVFWVS